VSYDGIRLMYGPAMRVPMPRPAEIERVLRDYADSTTGGRLGVLERRVDALEAELRALTKRDRLKKRRRAQR
jgi:hypothetical protein